MRRPTPFDSAAGVDRLSNRLPAPVPVQMPLEGPDPRSIGDRPLLDSVSLALPAAIGNLRLSISETFLNRIVAREEQRPGDVRDFVLGAQVTGRQVTDTKVRLDLLPSTEKLRGLIVLNGVTQSQTTGVTPQAMVDTAGQQQFQAYKEIFFDGNQFSTRHAIVFARARNKTVGAVTPLTGTLIGGIADRIAFRAAEKRQAEGEAIARDKVAERVFPEFDRNIDEQLAKANLQLEEQVRPVLRRLNLLPTQQQVASSDTHWRYCLLLGTESPQLSADTLESNPRPDGIKLDLHESLLHAAVDKAGLKGLKTTDQEMRTWLAPFEWKQAPTDDSTEEDSTGADTSVPTQIEFDESDPLTVRFDAGRLLVTVRAKFKPAGQALLPPLALTIACTSSLEGDKIVFSPGKVEVKPQNDSDNNAATGFALKFLAQAIESKLTKFAVDRALPASYWPFGGSVPQVNELQFDNGWVSIVAN